MQTEALITLLAANFISSVAPGPNGALVMNATLRFGPLAGSSALAGALLARLVWLAVATLAMLGLLSISEEAVAGLRKASAAAVILLGIVMLTAPGARRGAAAVTRSLRDQFWLGMGVGLANPLSLVFFVAVLPRFFARQSQLPDLVWIVAATLAGAALALGLYVVAARPLSGPRLAQPLNRVFGVCLVIVGAAGLTGAST